MSAFVKSQEGGGYILYCKGASEILLDLCTETLSKDGEVIPLDDEQKAEFERVIQEYAENGFSILFSSTLLSSCSDSL